MDLRTSPSSRRIGVNDLGLDYPTFGRGEGSPLLCRGGSRRATEISRCPPSLVKSCRCAYWIRKMTEAQEVLPKWRNLRWHLSQLPSSRWWRQSLLWQLRLLSWIRGQRWWRRRCKSQAGYQHWVGHLEDPLWLDRQQGCPKGLYTAKGDAPSEYHEAEASEVWRRSCGYGGLALTEEGRGAGWHRDGACNAGSIHGYNCVGCADCKYERRPDWGACKLLFWIFSQGASGRMKLQQALAAQRGTSWQSSWQTWAGECILLWLWTATMTKYVERFGGYGRALDFGHVMWQVAMIMDHLQMENWHRAKDAIALLSVCLEM